MPRYNYLCENCEDTVTIFHGINDVYTDCEACGSQDAMRKMLSVPLLIKEQNVDKSGQKVGELSKEYIEANREILKQHKEEIKKDTYEPS